MEPSDPLTAAVSNVMFNDEYLISKEVQSLQELAIRGSWLTILDKTTALISLSLTPKHRILPHDHLIHLTFHVLALSKLRRYSDALTKLDASAPDLDAPSFLFQAYPHIYPNLTGSMIPFALRTLRAVLPSFLSRLSDTIDRLYSLLAFVRSQLRTSSSPELWRLREEFVISILIGQHSTNHDHLVCVALLTELLAKDPNNVAWLSKLGYIYLQFGDIESAKAAFAAVEEKVTRAGDDVKGRNLVGRNNALLYLVGKDYVSAVREYDECIERDGADVAAINNKALCLMYLRDLADSIKVLESSLERVPTAALNETLVVNLCSMYELAYVNHSDIKKTLSNWIARLAPDDFDASCTRV